jgi:hypothetical protein
VTTIVHSHGRKNPLAESVKDAASRVISVQMDQTTTYEEYPPGSPATDSGKSSKRLSRPVDSYVMGSDSSQKTLDNTRARSISPAGDDGTSRWTSLPQQPASSRPKDIRSMVTARHRMELGLVPASEEEANEPRRLEQPAPDVVVRHYTD